MELMMQTINGVVDSCWTKEKNTRFGPKKIHYCSVDGTTFETGFKKVFTEGEHINIQAEVKYGSLQYQPNANGGPPTGQALSPKTSGAKSFGNKGKFPIDPTDGQMSIIRQSSLTRAIETLAALGTPFAETDEFIREALRIALIYADFASGNDIMKFGGEDE